MNPDWLSQLAADRAPPAAGGWPPAPGWWALGGLALLLGVAGWLLWRRHARPSRGWRRAALRELAQLPDAAADDAAFARALQSLLRRHALRHFGAQEAAALHGRDWIAFVVEHGGTAWAGDAGSRLLRCAYGGRAALEPGDRERWLAGARAYLRACR